MSDRIWGELQELIDTVTAALGSQRVALEQLPPAMHQLAAEALEDRIADLEAEVGGVRVLITMWKHERRFSADMRESLVEAWRDLMEEGLLTPLMMAETVGRATHPLGPKGWAIPRDQALDWLPGDVIRAIEGM
jgi:hypothetical protein